VRKGLLYFFEILIVISLLPLLGFRWESVWDYVFGGVSPLWREIVMDFQAIDKWLIDRGAFPSLFAIGLLGLVFTWYFPQIWSHIRRYKINKEEFLKQFSSFEQHTARKDFAWNLELAFRSYRKKYKKTDLRDLLDNFEFPADFPPKCQLADFVKDIKWPNSAGNLLWKFNVSLHKDMLREKSKYINLADQYIAFLEGRRISAKFWDDWARKIMDKQLLYDDIERPLKANIRTIKALAISELAMNAELSWDHGPGKTPLFWLALGHEYLIDKTKRDQRDNGQ
jgi:hypothetical protein